MSITVLEEEIAHRSIEQRKKKSNLSLVTHGDETKKTLVKKVRKSSRLIDFLRFENEKRMYKHLSSNKNSFLQIPTWYSDIDEKALIMEYVNGQTIENFQVKGFAQGYIEFQHQEIPENRWLDLLNQSFRGFDYKIGGVAVFTLSRHENIKLTLKILTIYRELKGIQPLLGRKYWMHGDIHQHNFLLNADKKVYFIDFENSFYTQRWPLCEILGECIFCTKEEVKFDPSLLISYFRNLAKDSEIRYLDLEKQLRFAMLRKAIHVIIQTKYPTRKEIYTSFIKNKLDQKSFHSWFIEYVECNLQELDN